ncbi:MAG: type II toxin-antitoxin system HicA family toxin [Actinomycetota bacterium]
MNPEKLLRRLAGGSVKNVSFDNMQRLAEALGFELKRVSGSHHIFAHPEVHELVNLQEVDGQTKPYQVRQFIRLVERYSLTLEERA